MASLTYRLNIKNEDRGASSTKVFSSLYEAGVFFGKYKPASGETVELIRISDKVLISSK